MTTATAATTMFMFVYRRCRCSGVVRRPCSSDLVRGIEGLGGVGSDGDGRCRRSGVVRRPCSSDLVEGFKSRGKSIAYSDTTNMSISDNDDNMTRRRTTTTKRRKHDEPRTTPLAMGTTFQPARHSKRPAVAQEHRRSQPQDWFPGTRRRTQYCRASNSQPLAPRIVRTHSLAHRLMVSKLRRSVVTVLQTLRLSPVYQSTRRNKVARTGN